MLRSRLNPRGLQQIASLIEWQQSQLLGPAASLQQARPFASQQPGASSSTDPSAKFARDRKAFGASLSELRKEWARQRVEQLARKAASEEEERAARAAAKAAKAQKDAAAKEARRQQQLEKQAAEREIRAQAKIERLKRQMLREEVLEVAREERRQQLLAQSKNWITAATLDMRIKEAIDNPVPLFLGETVQPGAAATAAPPPLEAPAAA